MRLINNRTHNYDAVIAIGEKSAGNEQVGDMWFITKTFPKEASISVIMEWAFENDITGKLILTVDESTIEKTENREFF